jgi:predicted Zn-dependent protease
MLGWLCCQWRPQPRLADADVEFERAESLGRLKSDSFFHWATAHLRAGESQATLRICKRGLESHPEEPGLWRLKGLAEVRIGGSARQSSADGAASTAFRDSSPRSTAELSRVFKALLQLSAVSKDDAMRKEVIKEWRHVLPDDPYRPV